MKMVEGPANRLPIRYHSFEIIESIKVCRIEYAFHDSMHGDGRYAERATTMRSGNHHVSRGFQVCVVDEDSENISLFHRTHAVTTRDETFHRSWFWSWISRRIARLSNCKAYPG